MTAVISGVKRIRAIWINYAILGTCLGIAGFFALIRSSSVTSGSSTLALNIITAVVLGGFPINGGAKAKFHSAIIGVLLIVVLTNGLTLLGLDPAVTLVLKGILFITVIGLTTDRSKGKLVQ